MSSQLDPAILAAISAEARECFLDEDAPEYLQMLEQGLQDKASPDFTALLRAAHSLKGGAGLASLTSLQDLAHKLEDVLLGIQNESIAEPELAWALVEKGIDEISYVLSQARTVDNAIANPELIKALEELTGSSSEDQQDSETDSNASGQHNLVYNTLAVELEASLAAIEELELDTPQEVVEPILSGFIDECMFIAETLELPWLVDAVATIESLLTEADALEALLTVQAQIPEIRQQRDLYLEELESIQQDNELEAVEDEPAIFTDENDRDNELDFEDSESGAGFFDFGEEEEEEQLATVMFAPPKASPEKIIANVAQASTKPAVNQEQLKIPLERLQDMTNNVEELILAHSRFNRQQRLLNQANRRLRSLTRQFEPIREQIQDLYGRLAVDSTNMPSQGSQADDSSFDSLEMDRYTDLHSSLQSFQELMLQIQEARTDIDFIDRELAEDIEQTQKNLDHLYSQVTDSRLVPFDLLAKRFVPQIRGLSKRFDKPVELKIAGNNIPVDQILLEQLQTPLTHLLNNAFDHGIESKYERFANGKPEIATILLTAQLQRNQLVITIKDDGGGIKIEKVYKRAVERGICPPDKSIKDFQPEEILNWIFEPDFSTAAKVSDISGRGMGLDIVLNLIRQLKGQLQVQTDAGLGSTFTISLPVNLSLQSLMLVQLQSQTIAIPHTSIREILPYRDLYFTDKRKKQLNWHEQIISLAAASSLFPCPRKPLNFSQGKVGIVLQTAFEPVAILVDNIVGEEKLIIKPFDETIPIPPYMAGCTVLGTGEVIPVILPQGLQQEIILSASTKDSEATIANTTSTILIAEDSVATRRMLDKILTSVGYKVLVCRDGQEAIEQIDSYKGRIDLILSDVEMPRINGFELLEQVRAKPAFQNTPIVMATSRTGDRHRQEATRLGATDYLGKPVQPQKLIDTVSRLLKTR